MGRCSVASGYGRGNDVIVLRTKPTREHKDIGPTNEEFRAALLYSKELGPRGSHDGAIVVGCPFLS
jgi:hypothetical protein